MMSAGRRRVSILGSTGSVGRQALDVIAEHPDHLEVVGLVAGSDEEGLARQAEGLPGDVRTGLGTEAAVELAGWDGCDVVLNAVVGAAGLRASLAALESGKVLALANKESLIAGGEVCLSAAERGGGHMVPVDSEHASVARCLAERSSTDVARIVLTASGGPFRTRRDLAGVTVEEALAHPTWSMGSKITIDSATLMNKGFEVIEAHFLFGVDYDRISVLVHPQSLVHAIVELSDGSLLMHAAITDMRLPIQAALLEDPALYGSLGTLDLAETSTLEFEELDRARFPAVNLAFQAGRQGRSYPAVLNAANEVAVHAFLAGELGFEEIASTVERVLEHHEPMEVKELPAVLEADEWARSRARMHIERSSTTLTGGR